jgi:spermidine/putrescine transport system substrate-binding protein
VSVAGCLGAVGLGGPDTLRVATWSGNTVDGVREHFAVPYEEENDVTVEVVGEWDQLLAKVRSAPEDDPPYDMMISYGPLLLRGDNDDLFMEIDRDNIPNTENIYPYVRDEYRTQYNKYGIETGGGVLTIVYDEERLAFDPSGWRDFLRDDFSKGSLEAGFWTDTVNIAAIMMQEMPGSEELYHEEHHDELLDLIRTLYVEHLRDRVLGGPPERHLRHGEPGHGCRLEPARRQRLLEHVHARRQRGLREPLRPRPRDGREGRTD